MKNKEKEQKIKKEIPREVLEVLPVNNYSRVEYQPQNEIARGFARLLEQKNLTQGNIERIKELGYRVEIKGGAL